MHRLNRIISIFYVRRSMLSLYIFTLCVSLCEWNTSNTIRYNQIFQKILLFDLCLFVWFLAQRLMNSGRWALLGERSRTKPKWAVTTTKTHAQKHVRRRHVFKLFLLILWLWKKWRKEFRRRDENIMLSDSSFLWKTGTWEIPKIYNRRDASSRSSSIGVDCTVISFFLIV